MVLIIMPVMRRHAQVSLLVAAGILLMRPATAFGPEGHRLVGAIAAHHLCTDARREVNRLLGGESLARAGRWPDWIRSRSEWQHTRTWHYMNVADDAPVNKVSQKNGSGRGTGDVLWAIGRFDRQFADEALSREKRAEALRFLAHFIADVHQPLHVGRAEDRGGNNIAVLMDGRPANLHAVWDGQALLKAARDDGADGTDARFRALLGLTAERVTALQADGPVAWARESQALRPTVYSFAVPDDGSAVELTEAYLATATVTLNLRLSQAGVRLAGRINRVYCRPP